MTIRLRAFAWFIALSAIMLRAALPAGWMPAVDGSGGTRLVICTGHGPLAAPIQSQKRIPLPGRTNETCPFAAVAHLSPPALFALLPAPPLKSENVDLELHGQVNARAPPSHGSNSARAPPSFA
jgi:hypothetical protein